MTSMRIRGESWLDDVQDAAGLVEAMRQLKEGSGLTFRELEERAARNGDALARSTIADTLRRQTLPRPEMLAAFVRACGDGQRVDAWLAARRAVAGRPGTAPAAGPLPEAGGSGDRRARPPKGRPVLLAGAVAAAGLAVIGWAAFPDGFGDEPARAAVTSDSGATPQGPLPVDGWVTVRPARTPGLCLTDGRDRRGAYASTVAVQLPCAEAPVPRTYLEPLGGGLYRIQWHHPTEGKGCLTVMGDGPVRGMLEPREDCAHSSVFHLEAAHGGGGFRLRADASGRCIGILGDDTGAGAEAVQEPCTNAADQLFLVRAD
jgi:hypothetical protein